MFGLSLCLILLPAFLSALRCYTSCSNGGRCNRNPNGTEDCLKLNQAREIIMLYLKGAKRSRGNESERESM
ncbi:hypothetical protein chiPu_0021258 [Chiloscyllium punctatum]|uniref:Uncharacterized protein n=1 Tax=Chiloscyllium punctatum TaxID=137246 RepID=A0A401RPK8_CHIPU|nr:hypothetical protein [Chiloscyllium punctatum]